jgi:hypothetical protein
MSFETSMIYTMGMALNRALEHSAIVDLLVGGVWMTGAVVISDGYGVVLDNGEEHTIVKIDTISAVRIHTEVPMRQRLTTGAENPFVEPMPMPGPRAAAS